MLLKTIPTIEPLKTAESFRLALAQHGYTSTIIKQGKDVLVRASDGKEVLFKLTWPEGEFTLTDSTEHFDKFVVSE